MNKICFLDQFPVELIHNLFDYFSISEILFSFSNVSDYINNILQFYPINQLDLQSIQLSDFNYVCHRIQPEQVISLTLSDNDDTAGQSDIFLSRFQIEQFIRLQPLSFKTIDITSLQTILKNVMNLKHLHSLSMDTEKIIYESAKTSFYYKFEVNTIESFLRNIFLELFPRLKKLYLNKITDYISIPYPNLRQLKLTECNFQEFRAILFKHPNLDLLMLVSMTIDWISVLLYHLINSFDYN